MHQRDADVTSFSDPSERVWRPTSWWKRALAARFKRIWPGALIAVIEFFLLACWVFFLGAYLFPPSTGLLAVLVVFYGLMRLPIRVISGAYDAHAGRRFPGRFFMHVSTELLSVFLCVMVVTMDAVHLPVGFHVQTWPLGILLSGWVVVLHVGHAGWIRRMERYHRKGSNQLNVLLVGSGPDALRFVRWHDYNARVGYRVISVVRTTSCEGKDRFGYNVVGDVSDDLLQISLWQDIDVVVLAVSSVDEPRIRQALRPLRFLPVIRSRSLLNKGRPYSQISGN